MKRGEHRVAGWLVTIVLVLVTLFFGALLFERPADERVAKAFAKADPGADLVIISAGTLTWRTVTRGRRFNRYQEEVPATTLWCAHERRNPERRMAIEYQNITFPLMSGPRTLVRSWAMGGRTDTEDLLAACTKRTTPAPSMGSEGGIPVPLPASSGPPALP